RKRHQLESPRRLYRLPSNSSCRHQEAFRLWRQDRQVFVTSKTEKYASRLRETGACAADQWPLQFGNLGHRRSRAKLCQPVAKRLVRPPPTLQPRVPTRLVVLMFANAVSVGRRTKANTCAPRDD